MATHAAIRQQTYAKRKAGPYGPRAEDDPELSVGLGGDRGGHGDGGERGT